ncbi:NAD(P)H-binding protein [Nocardiopsis potens]|uniref:NAD(P)H-binding protein n=1 Tax=Nocardiopsis potens TaxID=1246458 RepID=UPI000344D9FA|nr:NAD(P)H-binding protein [Nocardiopsis potens]
MAERSVHLVVGATGNVGRKVAEGLLAEGRAVRALVRDPRSAALPEGAEAVRGDLTDPAGLAAAAAGADSAFLVWPSPPVEAAPAAVGAIAAGTGRIVYLSSAGIDDRKAEQADPVNRFHARLERLVEDSGAEWAHLRCASFAASLLHWADQVRAGVVREAFGGARRALIHERDIADVAVRALAGGGRTGRRLMLSGPAALSQVEQVRIIGEVLGRPVRFEELSEDEVRAAMRAEGWAEPDIDGMLAAYAVMAETPQPVWNTVQEVTGRPARTFREWAADHAHDFA